MATQPLLLPGLSGADTGPKERVVASAELSQELEDGVMAKSDLEPLRPKRQAIGRQGILTLIIGNVGIVGISGFLVWLWYSSTFALRGSDPGQTWMSIVLSGWATRSVTICTAVLRLAIGSQTGLLMSMVAALILEDTGAPLGSAAILSILRAVQVAPHNMWPAFKAVARRRSTTVYAVLIAVSLLITTTSQFASTILLSDMQATRIRGLLNETTLRVSSPTHAREGFNVWKSTPIFYRFGDLIGEPVVGEGFIDSGKNFRAFLPYASESDRATLRSYAGPASVTQTRVVCFPPAFQSVIYALRGTDIPFSDRVERAIEFAVDGEWAEDDEQKQSPGLRLIMGEQSMFNCTMPIASQSNSSWPISLCSVKFDLQFRGGITFGHGFPNGTSNDPYSQWRIRQRQFLILNSTLTNVQTASLSRPGTASRGPNMTITEFKFDGVWTKGFDKDGKQVFAASACQTGFEGFTANVNMTSAADGPSPEPQIGFDPASDTYNTTAVRRLIHTGGLMNDLALASRGVLKLSGIPENPNYDSNYSPDHNSYELMPMAPGRNPCLYLYSHANRTGPLGESANEYLVAMTQDMLRETGSLPVALEALFSTVRQMLYYNNLARLTGPEQKVSTVASVEALFPVRWIGIGFLMACIGIHWLLLFLGGILFRKRARSTMLGNVWQAVAQLVTEETIPLLEQADGMRDDHFQALLVKGGREHEFVGVLRARAGARTELGVLYRS